MKALKFTGALIMPAGGVVDGARVVNSTDDLAHARRVELAPALVEGHPHGDAGAVVQDSHHFQQFPLKFLSPGLLAPTEQNVGTVLYVLSSDKWGGDDGGE